MPEGSSPKRAQVRPAGKTVRADGTVTHARYSKKLTREICRRIAGGEVWHKICNTGRLPSYTTLYDWLRRYPDFAEDFAQAKEMAADLRADKVLMVAEESTAATVQSDRLRVGALQWHAGKAAPKRYGSKAGDDVAEEGAPRRLIIEVRHFETAYRPDGTAYTREILPGGDGDRR
jgi:hypothetical protein